MPPSDVDAQAIAVAVQAEIARLTEASFAAMSPDQLGAAIAALEEQLDKAKLALASAAPVAVAQKAADPNSFPDLPWGCTRTRAARRVPAQLHRHVYLVARCLHGRAQLRPIADRARVARARPCVSRVFQRARSSR